jgi:polyphosphate glucokinase
MERRGTLNILGVDIGGSEIKAAPVDTTNGMLTAPARRLPTPELATPAAVSKTIADLAAEFSWSGPVGCGFPGPIIDGTVRTAENVHHSWVGVSGNHVVSELTGLDVVLLNDGDAAGIAEVSFGAAQGQGGTVLVLTFGTGIGSALFTDGHLMSNTELGLLVLEQGVAEQYASARTRSEEELTYQDWSGRVSQVLSHIKELFYPSLVVVGGGISKRWSDFSETISTELPVVRAEFGGDAGIVGAALFAAQQAGAATAPQVTESIPTQQENKKVATSIVEEAVMRRNK